MHVRRWLGLGLGWLGQAGLCLHMQAGWRLLQEEARCRQCTPLPQRAQQDVAVRSAGDDKNLRMQSGQGKARNPLTACV